MLVGMCEFLFSQRAEDVAGNEAVTIFGPQCRVKGFALIPTIHRTTQTWDKFLLIWDFQTNAVFQYSILSCRARPLPESLGTGRKEDSCARGTI